MTLQVRCLSFVVLIACLAPAALHADTFTFSATGSGFTSSGTLTGTLEAGDPGVYDITGITGTVNGVTITGILAPGQLHLGTSNDNLLNTNVGSTLLDYDGIGFTFGSPSSQGNFYYYDGEYVFQSVVPGGNGAVDDIQFAVTDTTAVTPEPSTLMLFGTGVLGLAGAARRRLMA